MATLGQKLRELRHQKGYKLNEVAEGADLSISFISLIERDKASISVENLQKLANFYNVRLFQIFQDIEEEDAYIVRKQELEAMAKISHPSTPALFLLSPEENLTFKSMFATIPPGDADEHIQLLKGEAFIQVKEGQLLVSLPNKKPVALEAGDSVHLTSFKGTTIKSAQADKPVKLLIVASAPTQHFNQDGDSIQLQELKG